MSKEQKIEEKKYSFIESLYIPEILKGLKVTISHFFKKKFTLEYPDVRKEIYPRFRGRHRLVKRENGKPKCVACELCATACPTKCIKIEAAESPDPAIEKYPLVYEIDVLRCIFCGFCVEACPVGAIEMGQNYELAEYKRDKLIYSKNKLLEE